MQRFAAVWTASPRKLMGALLMLAIAGGLAVGSGASFTSQTASPGNMITAGALTANNDKKNNGVEGAIFHADNMKPGDTVTGTVTVSNTGNVDGDFEALDSSDNVTATPIDDTVISSVGTSPVSLGTWTGNSNHKYRFTVKWPTGLTGDNAYMSSGVSMDFTWSATQA